MRVLCAISGCQSYEDADWHTPMRETWLPELANIGWDYKFFMGWGAKSREDAVLINCDDRYYDLTSKTKLKIWWAIENNYDYIFACFPDTYACPNRLVESGFRDFDYYGNNHCHPSGNPYCHGGPGYFISKKAAQIAVSDPSNYPNEDCWLGNVLHRPDVVMGDSKDFAWIGHSPAQGPLKSNTIITAHLSNADGGYRPELMRDKHARYLESMGLPFKQDDIIPTWERQ
jgi:hypothetical protein